MWSNVVEETGEPGENHRTWTGDHYPATCIDPDSNPDRRGDKRVRYPLRYPDYNLHPEHQVFKTTHQMKNFLLVRWGDGDFMKKGMKYSYAECTLNASLIYLRTLKSHLHYRHFLMENRIFFKTFC